MARPTEFRVAALAWVALVAAAWTSPSLAQPAAPAAAPPSDSALPAAAEPVPDYGATARVSEAPATESQARSVVTRAEMDERLPRSAPDALRYEPGVSVQQTAHGQASPYVRGMTGQAVVHMFDGIRMNHGVYRQGPNQYFFTVDSWTLDRLEVVRGSASTYFGSDALGGAILAFPRVPALALGARGVQAHPALFGRFASADAEMGGRAEGELLLDDHTGALFGIGYRDLDRLESGGIVRNPGRALPDVPRFEADGRTQLGTGFEEASFDARVHHRFRHTLELVGAAYGFREFDAPRTDQCPPPEAPIDECLRIEEQFRTLAYLALRGDAGDAIRDLDLNVSWQEHAELRTNDRPRSFIAHTYDNTIHTLGASLRASTPVQSISHDATWRLHYGLDAYRDEVASTTVRRITDPDLVGVLAPEDLRNQLRGQYLDGSIYLSAGAFAEAEIVPVDPVTFRGGGRLAVVGARGPADGDAASESTPVHKRWGAAVGRAGVETRPLEGLSVHVNFDQGFRAPNLDDLTSRQEVGSAFQFENPLLVPEHTNTLEAGAVATPGPLRIESWVFATWLSDGIMRTVRDASDCPPAPGCPGSRTQYQLVNADDTALILGSEGGATAELPEGFDVRATYSYAWGEGPKTLAGAASRERVPLSRIPPLNGTVEAVWRQSPSGAHAGGALRWALAQRRLAPSDLSDARIPLGGTPGYAVFDLRAGWQLPPYLRISLVFENVLDAAYRVHGSSINGPGRGLIAVAQGRL